MRKYFESCCHNRKIGHSWVTSVLNSKYYAFLTDLVVWKALCPEMDVLFVSHDFSPKCTDYFKLNYRFAFVIKDDRITCVKGRNKAKKLYQIYNIMRNILVKSKCQRYRIMAVE